MKKSTLIARTIGFIILLIFALCVGVALYKNNQNKIIQNSQTVNNLGRCSRTTPYQNPPEFGRALSLILQRHEQYLKQKTNVDESSELPYRWGQDFQSMPAEVRGNYSFWQSLKQEQNCIKIEYMTADQEENDTEAFFNFSSSSNLQELDIKVSKKYQAKDDLLTAVLLSHELAHADEFIMLYPNNKQITKKDCFSSETTAFIRQLKFLSMLNNEEKESLKLRLQNMSSPEIVDLRNLLVLMQGKSSSEIQKIIENDLGYIKQCDIYPN